MSEGIKEISKEEILYHIYRTSNDVALHFDRNHQKEVDNFIGKMVDQINFIHKMYNSDEAIKDDRILIVSGILWKCLNSLLCALEIARRGYRLEPCVIVRTVLESSCSAFDLFHDFSRFNLTNDCKFKSIKSITFTKKKIPIVGQNVWYIK